LASFGMSAFNAVDWSLKQLVRKYDGFELCLLAPLRLDGEKPIFY